MEAATGPAPFFLDAHHYSGGLRVARLGTDPARPSWAPDASAGLVGFRDEVRLEGDDTVVEFARFRVAGRHLTWVGVYRRAVDARLGDRGNHAGVGVWLLEQDVRDPRALLVGLSSIAAHVVEVGPAACAPDADMFASGDYLPRCVRPRAALPTSLAGWPYSEHMSPDTQLFLAEGSEADRLDRAAEQLLRCSALPAPGPEVARAIILMRASAATGEPTVGRLEVLRRGVARDFMDELPKALAEASERYATLERLAHSAQDETARTQAALNDAQGELSRANERIATLDAQVADSDILSRLASIDSGINFLDSAARRSESALDHLRREVARVATAAAERRGSSRHAEAGPPSLGYPPATTMPRSGERISGGRQLSIGVLGFSWMEVVLAALAVLVLVVVVYLVLRRWG